MKEKVFSVFLSVIILCSSFCAASVSGAEKIIRTYFDMTVDNWENASDRLNSDSTTVQSTLSGTTYGGWDYYASEVSEELLYDAQRGSVVWKLTKNPGTGSNRSRMRMDTADNTFERTTLWTEITFKYEGSIAPMGWEYNMAVAPVYIDHDGNIRKFAGNFCNNIESGAIISKAPLSLGKWYTLSVATDYPNAPAADGGPLHVWLNGEKIFSGTDYNSNFRLENKDGTAFSPFNYIDFSFGRPESSTSELYIDTFKMFTTAALDNHPEEDFANLSITDGNADDEFTVSQDVISVPNGATVADLKNAFVFPENASVSVSRNNSVLSDEAEVSGADIYVNASNGMGFRAYETKVKSQEASCVYFDMNMDNWQKGSDRINADGTSLSGLSWVSVYSPLSQDLVSNEVFGGKAWEIEDDTTSEGHYARARYTATIPTSFPEDEVLWTEISFKYSGQIASMGWEFDSARSPVHINSNGEVRRFGRWVYNATETGKSYEGGTSLGYNVVPDVWYTLCVALDFSADTDKKGAPLYAWINGTQIAFGTDRASELCAGGAFKYIDFWIDQVSSGSTAVTVDDFKCYTTEYLDSHHESKFSLVSVTDKDDSDGIVLSENYITAPETVTVSQLESALSPGEDCKTVVTKDGSVIENDALADGGFLYVIHEEGGYKTFEINPEYSPVCATYFDMNMDNWQSTSQKLGSDGSSVSGFNWVSVYSPTSDGVSTDQSFGGKSWVINEDTDSTGHYARARFNSGIPKRFDTPEILWTEISLKFEESFVPVGWEHDMAVAPIYIDSDGKVRMFVQRVYDDGEEKGEYVDPDFQLELGSWYHFVVALDFSSPDAATGAPMTVWINGEKVLSEAPGHSYLKSGSGFNYYDLWIDRPSFGGSTVWVDNFKAYTTEQMDNHAQSEFEGLEITDTNSEDEISVDGNLISAPEGATVSQIEDALEFPTDTICTFIKNSMIISGDETVDDSVLFIKSSITPGFKKYVINPYVFSPKTYYDISFENWTDQNSMLNRDGSVVSGKDGKVFEWVGETKDMQLLYDEIKKSNVIALASDSSSDALIRLELEDSSFEKCVLWTEFSFRFDGGFTPFGYRFCEGVAPFYVDEDGYMRMFAKADSPEDAQYISTSMKLEKGQWYHISIAMDFRGLYAGSGAKTYVRINGANLLDKGSSTSEFSLVDVTKDESGNITGAAVAENFGHIEFFAGKTKEGTVTISLDNMKLYTAPTVDNHPAQQFEEVILEDINSADHISAFGYEISVPEGTTVNQVKKAFTADGSISITIDGSNASDSLEAQNADLYVNSSNGIGFRRYEIVADVDSDTITPLMYYDVNFDGGANWHTKWVNRANPGRELKYLEEESDLSLTDVAPALTDDENGASALSLTDSGNSGIWCMGSDSGFVFSRKDYEQNTIWYEISVKYENGIIPAFMNATGKIFEITSDGSLLLGQDAIRVDESLEEGKWYHIVIAIDSTDNGSKLYMWLDGKEKVKGVSISSFEAEGLNIGVSLEGNSGSSISLDNIKVYAHPKAVYSGLDLFEGTKDIEEGCVEISYLNDTGANIETSFILGLYDESHLLKEVVTLENETLKTGYGTIKIENTKVQNIELYKLFIWSSWENIKPVAENVIIDRKEKEEMAQYAFNPFLPPYEYIPDGEPYVFDGRVYVYGSHDQYNGDTYCDDCYMGWSAPVDDLSDWRFEGEIFNRADDPNYKGGDMRLHAPDVAKGPDGRYYMYYSINGTGALGVAVCDTPAGHYEFYARVEYPDGTYLGQKSDDPMPLDPAIFVDSDSRVYLYMGYVPGNPTYSNLEQSGRKIQGCFCVELDSDMKTIIGEEVCVAPGWHTSDGTSFEGYGFFEAASMRYINDKYYFIYSPDSGTNLCYATGDSPVGPFTFGGVIINNTDYGYKGNTIRRAPSGNNHGSVVCVNGQYYIFYHRQTRSGLSRQACAEKIYINDDGSIDQVCMTSHGLGGEYLPANGSYPAYIACNIISSGARHAQDKPDGDATAISYVSGISKGDVVGFKFFKFEGDVTLSVDVKSVSGGKINVYTDDEMTNLVGTIDVNPALDVSTYSTVISVGEEIAPLYLEFECKEPSELYAIHFE